MFMTQLRLKDARIKPPRSYPGLGLHPAKTSAVSAENTKHIWESAGTNSISNLQRLVDILIATYPTTIRPRLRLRDTSSKGDEISGTKRARKLV